MPFTLAAAYYAALVPMLAVYAWHVGVPPLLHKFLLCTPGLLLVSVAIGALTGVLFIGRSLAAATGAGVGFYWSMPASSSCRSCWLPRTMALHAADTWL